MEPIYINP